MRSRLAVAAVGIPIAALVVWAGGIWFAAAVALLAVLALNELFSLTAEYRPLRWAAHLSAVLAILLAWLVDDSERGVILGLALMLLLAAIAGLVLPRREEVALRIGVTLFGAVYIGFPLAILVATRQLPDGTGAVVNVLVGTWAFDTFSYAGGRMWGTRQIAARTSPGKTCVGFVIGVVGGTLAVWVAGLYMDWIDHAESLAVGLAICLAAYVGDLFESLLKRDARVKDSGRLLMGHGGVLDRFDSMLFASVAAYLVTVFLVY